LHESQTIKLNKDLVFIRHTNYANLLSAMVVSNEGVLIKCDPQMKQFILFLDEKQPTGSKIVLKDLDATHVFVETKYVETIKNKIEELMEQQV
jgi:TFIIH basal transcription factor complex TTD-A subunit